MRILVIFRLLSFFAFYGVFMIGFDYSQVEESDLPEELGTAQGVHKIHLNTDDIPLEFRDFDYILFEKLTTTDDSGSSVYKDRKVKIGGEIKLKGGSVLKFEIAYFTQISSGFYKGINAKTVQVNGIRYSFRGEFLEKKIYDENIGGYTRIKGVLTKFDKGRKVAIKRFPFYEYAEL